MSHKNKECLRMQAKNQFQKITCLGRSKYEDKIQAGKEYDRLVSSTKSKPAISKQEYINSKIRDKIYSIKTYSTYEKHNNYFIKWVEENYPAKERRTLEQCRQYVPTWLQSRIDKGLSPYTIQTEAAGLGKLYQCAVSEFGVSLPERERGNITRSREYAARDYGFSIEKNQEIINFCRGTGLRRNELENLTKEQLIDRGNGEYALAIRGKGGRYREAPIIGAHKQEIVDRIKASEGRVWERVPSHMDVHGYRSDYATAIYKAYERENIPEKDRYYCRDDRKKEVMDKAAMLEASRALGHNRIDVVAGHYIR